MSGLFTASAPSALPVPGSLPMRFTAAPRALATRLMASGLSISSGIVLFLILALIALVVVIVLGMWMWRSPGQRSARTRRIQDAAAADVAAIEEDDKFIRPDAPGRQEDDL
jgi:hypothetical protein